MLWYSDKVWEKLDKTFGKGGNMAHSKTTSKKVASKASKLLRKSHSKTTKSVAGSALSQKHGKKSRR